MPETGLPDWIEITFSALGAAGSLVTILAIIPPTRRWMLARWRAWFPPKATAAQLEQLREELNSAKQRLHQFSVLLAETRAEATQATLVAQAVNHQVAQFAARLDRTESTQHAVRPKRRKLQSGRVLWSASEVPSVDDKNVPYCPLCDQHGLDTVLRRDAPKPPQAGMMRSTNAIVGALAAIAPKGVTLVCDHPCHIAQPFTETLSDSEWYRAANSDEIRRKTQD